MSPLLVSWIWRLSVKLLGFRCDVIRLQHVLCRKSRKWGLRGCVQKYVCSKMTAQFVSLVVYVCVGDLCLGCGFRKWSGAEVYILLQGSEP